MAKIRITLSDYNQIIQLHEEIRVGEHLDANYILSKMFVDNAFAFCMFNKEVSIVFESDQKITILKYHHFLKFNKNIFDFLDGFAETTKNNSTSNDGKSTISHSECSKYE